MQIQFLESKLLIGNDVFEFNTNEIHLAEYRMQEFVDRFSL